ncbi:MAG: SDR family NAD(P)-dependent oxidoreductase [Pirellulales bacterium]
MRTLREKWALVTGAGSGIGRAIALRLAHDGAHLWLVDVRSDDLQATAQAATALGGQVRTSVVDLAVRAEVEELAAAVREAPQPLDVLVNNAGVAFYGPTLTMTDAEWERLMAVNLEAPLLLTRRLLPLLLQRPEAHVVNVASMYGLVALPKACAYHVSKFGLVGFSEALRAELAGQGVGVTAVCPGFVRTRLFTAGLLGGGESRRREPPKWLSTSPEHVADLTVLAIYRNRRQVVVTWLAHALFAVKRFVPGLLDAYLQRQGAKRRQARESAERCQSSDASHALTMAAPTAPSRLRTESTRRDSSAPTWSSVALGTTRSS